MEFHNIKEFKNGWILGDFDPSLIRTKFFEVAHHSYTKNAPTVPHVHLIATEINLIITGEMLVNGKVLTNGDIFVVEPNECPAVIFCKDTELIIIKIPSIPSDKYLLTQDIKA